jgi:ubiquinone/menaquinone biosynthesis C-methylase UbiE
MELIGIRPGLIIGEVGAGRGRVTVHLAARVGDTGKIYATDIDPAAIEYLKERCRRQGIANVEVITGLVDDARFPQNSLDLVFMSWVLHHVDKPVPLLRSLMPSLKPWGFVVMVEPTPAHTEQSGRMLTRERVGQKAREGTPVSGWMRLSKAGSMKILSSSSGRSFPMRRNHGTGCGTGFLGPCVRPKFRFNRRLAGCEHRERQDTDCRFLGDT